MNFNKRIPRLGLVPTSSIITELMECDSVHPLECVGEYVYYGDLVIYSKGAIAITISGMLKTINDRDVWCKAINLMNSSRLSYSKKVKKFIRMFYRYIVNTELLDIAIRVTGDVYKRFLGVTRDRCFYARKYSIVTAMFTPFTKYTAVIHMPTAILQLRHISPSIRYLISLISNIHYRSHARLHMYPNEQALLVVESYTSEEDLDRRVVEVLDMIKAHLLIMDLDVTKETPIDNFDELINSRYEIYALDLTPTMTIDEERELAISILPRIGVFMTSI